MRSSLLYLLAGVASMFLLPLGVALAAFFVSDDGKPIVLHATRYTSPDFKWVATVEELDNGMGFGQGMVYDEVHLQRAKQKISGHGDKESSAIFYIDTAGKSNAPASVHWTDAKHLTVTYDPNRSEAAPPGKSIRRVQDIEITYQVSAK